MLMNPAGGHQESDIQRINTEVREVKLPIKGRPIIEAIPNQHFVQKYNQVTSFPNK